MRGEKKDKKKLGRSLQLVWRFRSWWEDGGWVGVGGGGRRAEGHPFLWKLPKGDLHSVDQGCSWAQIIALSFSACHRDILAICCKLSLMSRKSGLRGHGGCFSSAPGADLTRGRWHVEIRSRRPLHFAGGTIVKTKSETFWSVRVVGAQPLCRRLPGLLANSTAQI